MRSEAILMAANTVVTLGLALRCWRLERALTDERCQPLAADAYCVAEMPVPLTRPRPRFDAYGVDISVAPTIPVGDARA